MTELNELTAVAAAQAIASGDISSEALTTACLERISAREEDVRAWAFIDPALALAQARDRDRTAPVGPLHGVPIGLKDIIDTHDMPTEYGSAIYPGHRPVGDAACAAMARAAGAVILGKTVTTEFAFVNPGKTRNPNNLAHTPGGSSSGSAASVADFMAPLGLGTQTGGSVIRPASFCGVVGYKPTHGHFSYAGTKLLAGSLDTLGAMSRSVADLALLRAAFMGAPSTVTALETLPRLGLCRTPWWDRADPATHAAVEAAASAAAAAGASLRDAVLPPEFAGLESDNNTIMFYEGRRSLAHEFNLHFDKLSDKLKARIPANLDIPYEEYRNAILHARQCRDHFDRFMDDFDALIVPSAAGEAPLGFETTGDATFNRAWTTIGAPCITLPGNRGANGLPVGVQIVTRAHDDERLLSVAHWCESAFAAS
ncbi:MAG: amidase [Alphaproteobacteria bacterium]|jgi:Asp-tRNA(Asn)/Glu-tRNA(Gln) amidotransferase A subunit family amidase